MSTASITRDFDEIARLSDSHTIGTDRYLPFLVSLLPAEARRVLDIGCGLGRLSERLAGAECEVTGIDLSPEMIKRARLRSQTAPSLSFRCGDFLEAEFAAEFDCIFSSATLHHLPAKIAVSRMLELLRPGGRLVIHDLRRDSGALDQMRSHCALTHEALIRLIRTGRPLGDRAVRDAWARHGAGEEYLTQREAEEMAARLLPGAAVFYHWLWRYTIVWDKPAKEV